MDTPLPVLQHLRCLKRNLIVSLVVLLSLFTVIVTSFNSIIPLLLLVLRQGLPEDFFTQQAWLHSRTIFEGLSTRLQLSFQLALALSFPFHLANFFVFLSPGLRTKERRVVITVFFVGMVVAAVSLYYAVVSILPLSLRFLLSEGLLPQRVDLFLNYRENLVYLLRFLLAALLIFQLPLVVEVALYLRLVSRRTLWRSMRYITIAIFAVSAIISPPDVVSQVMLAFPLLLLFLLALLVAHFFKLGED